MYCQSSTHKKKTCIYSGIKMNSLQKGIACIDHLWSHEETIKCFSKLLDYLKFIVRWFDFKVVCSPSPSVSVETVCVQFSKVILQMHRPWVRLGHARTLNFWNSLCVWVTVPDAPRARTDRSMLSSSISLHEFSSPCVEASSKLGAAIMHQ